MGFQLTAKGSTECATKRNKPFPNKVCTTACCEILRTKHCLNKSGGMHSCAACQEGKYTLTQSSDSRSSSSSHRKHTCHPSHTQCLIIVFFRAVLCVTDNLCSWRNGTSMLLIRWWSRMGVTWLRQCVIPFLTNSTSMHIPPFLFTQCFILKISKQAMVKTFAGKDFFLWVILQSVSLGHVCTLLTCAPHVLFNLNLNYACYMAFLTTL